MKMINPRSGHGYGPANMFECIVLLAIIHPWYALFAILAIVAVIIGLRYIWKHLKWNNA